jgi:hypothetical protein
VIAYGRSPDAVSMLGNTEMFEELAIALEEIAKSIIDDFPVYEVTRMKDRQSRCTLKR